MDVRDGITDDFPNMRFSGEDSLDTTHTDCRHYRTTCHPGTGHFSGKLSPDAVTKGSRAWRVGGIVEDIQRPGAEAQPVRSAMIAASG
jgi:hypothetical protein